MTRKSKTENGKKAEGLKIVNLGYEVVDVSLLQAHPRNSRRHAKDAIKESMDANGFYGAVVARKRDGLLLKGHGSLEGAVAQGAKKIPVIWVDVDDATADRILIADNRTNDLASYDFTMLGTSLKMMEVGGNLLGTAFSSADISKMLQPPPPPKNFVQFNANAPVEHTCPKCGYAWDAKK
jgi:hypothetical protein